MKLALCFLCMRKRGFMNVICCSFEELHKKILKTKRKILMFGAGVVGQISTPEILKKYDLLGYVDGYLDNDNLKWGSFIDVLGKSFKVHSPKYLYECSKNVVILLNISRYSDVLSQLFAMECTENLDCFLMPMMLVHNYCMHQSMGKAVFTQTPVIPKKLNYMWLGRNHIPQKLKKCIDSWHEFCPDYEIIEWNEDNYDISKHPYMKHAYDVGAYGFVPDYARLDILYNYGGFYLDTDVELLRNIDDLCYQEAFCGVEKWQVLNFGGLSGAVPRHPMIKCFLEARETIDFIDENGNCNKNTCGFYDTKVAIDKGYLLNGTTQNIEGMNIYAYDYFHPYDYMTGTLNKTENTHSIHWFNGGWLDDKMREANLKTAKQYNELYGMALKNDRY